MIRARPSSHTVQESTSESVCLFSPSCPDLAVHSRKYRFIWDKLNPSDFLVWHTGELRMLKVGTMLKQRGKNTKEMNWKELDVPIIYVQLIAQLVAEDRHGDHNEGHEALRRQSYARQVLDEVAKEFKREFKEWKNNPAGIRFQTLNPILQRYLQGIPDAYTPSVRRAISGGDEPTIRDVTKFYLSRDPTDPDAVSLYRRNLLYIPESRWFLAVLSGKVKVADIDHFDKVRVNHDNIMEALAEDDGTTTAEGEESNISEVEVRAIFDEGLEDFFEDQLKRVVCVLWSPRVQPLTFRFPQPDLVDEIKAELALAAEEQAAMQAVEE